MQIDDKVLFDLMQWVAGNRGSKHGNPYCVPEVRETLKAIAVERGFKDIDNNFYDALTGWEV